MAKRSERLIPVDRIAGRIYLVRGQPVMLDSDLAELYGVATKVFNQAVSRNQDRFPDDFAFRLSKREFEHLKSQIVTSSWGGRRHLPRVFTQEGVAMLSSVLRSKRAVQVNVTIMRTFVRLRRMLAANEELARKVARHDRQIAVLFEQVAALLEAPERLPRQIGFSHPKR